MRVWMRMWWEYVCWCVFADGGACVRCDVWFGVFVSLSGNRLGAEGGAAMAFAVQHLTSLTSLQYV